MSRKTVRNTPFDEDEFAEALGIVKTVLSQYGVSLDDEIRFRRKDNTDGTWSKARVAGINKDLSILCYEEGRARSFLPGFAVDLELKTIGPRGGTKWIPLDC